MIGDNGSATDQPNDVTTDEPERPAVATSDTASDPAELPEDGASQPEPAMVVGIGASAGGQEQAMRFSEARLRMALDAAGMGSFVWYPQEDRGEPDRRMLELFGLQPDETLNLASAVDGLLNEDDRDRYAAAVERAVDPTGSGELHEEFRVVLPDETVRWVAVTARVIFENDKPVRMAGVAADRTGAKLLENEVEASAARLHALASASTDLLYRMSPDWTEMRQVTGPWIVGETILPVRTWLQEYVHPDDHDTVQQTIDLAVADSTPFELDHRALRADGSIGWTVSRAVPVFDQDGVVIEWIGSATDITARRQADASLIALTETLEQRVEQRTAQVRHLSRTLTLAEQQERQRLSHLLHDDLQQLLYAIQMQLTSAGQHAERAELELHVAATDKALALLEDAIARTRQLTVDLAPPLLDGEGLVEAIGWLRRHMRDLHALEVEVAAFDNVDFGDPERRVLVFQVVRELLFNVAKHARTDAARVEIDRDGDMVVVRVVDEGTGFDPKVLDGQPGDGELGMGLFGARQRVRMKGGDLDVKTRPGGGTTVVVHVPIDSNSDDYPSVADR